MNRMTHGAQFRAAATLAVTTLATAGCGAIRQPQAPRPTTVDCSPGKGLDQAICQLDGLGARLDANAAAAGQPRRTPVDVAADAMTPLTVAGLLLLVIGLGVAFTAGDPAPAGRDPEGPAVQGQQARTAARKDIGWALIFAGITPLIWHFAGSWALATVVFIAIFGVSAMRGFSVAAGARVADEMWLQEADAAFAAGRKVPEPHLTAAELRDLGVTGGWSCPEGAAAEAMLDRAGRPGPTHAAWFAACQATGLGKRDEAGKFTPAASIESVTALENGDVKVHWKIHDQAKDARSLQGAMTPFQRELRLKGMTDAGLGFSHRDDLAFATFTTGTTARAAAPAAPPPAPRPADPADSVWEL